jgi:polysaccharide export outer membrane protein
VRSTTVKYEMQQVLTATLTLTATLVVAAPLGAQSKPQQGKPAPQRGSAQPVPNLPPPAEATAAAGITPPPGYVIGPDDVLSVMYWREKDMSADVAVRPDGMITLPLLNEVQASGLTPDQLREKVAAAASKFVEDPSVTVVVKAINSRKVYVTGMVAKPGYYQLTGAMTVVQLLATAGGIQEFADSKNITIVRKEGGKQVAYAFNYKDFIKRKNLKQNIELKPGDTVMVP